MRERLFYVALILCALPALGWSLPDIKGKTEPSREPYQPFVNSPTGVPASEQPTLTPAPFNDPKRVWTLPELVDEGLKRNPNTTEAWALAKSAAADVNVARSAYYPTVTLGGNGGAAHDTTPLYPGSQRVNQFTAGPQIQIEYLLLDFGARSAGVEAARFNLLSRNFSFNQTLQSVVLSILTSYYNLDGAKAGVANAEAALALTTATFKSVEIKQSVGLGNSTDVAQARQGMEQSRFNLENARGVLSTAEIQLATSLGLPGNVHMEVAPPSNLPSLAILEEQVNKLIDLAFRQRPDLAGKYNTWRSRLAAADQAEANRWPTLTTGANLQRTYYQADSSGPGGNFKGSGNYDDASATLSFRFDIFDGGNKSNQALSAKKLAESAKADLLVSELGAISDVVTNFVTFKTAAKKMDAAQALLDASQKSLDSVQIGYKTGLKNILDLLTAQSNLAAARSTLSQSRTDLFVSSANLSNSTGSLLPGTGSATAELTPMPATARTEVAIPADTTDALPQPEKVEPLPLPVKAGPPVATDDTTDP